jgi:hypothetical protein
LATGGARRPMGGNALREHAGLPGR